MTLGAPGQGEFRNLIVEMRNRHIAFGMSRLMDLREEITTNDDLRVRMGIDESTQLHMIQLLQVADRDRRLITYNPDSLDLGTKIANAMALDKPTAEGVTPPTQLEIGENPFGADDIQMGSIGTFILPWDFSGADPNIPLADKLDMSNNGMLLLESVNGAIVAWTRLESRHRGSFITAPDSMRMYGLYQQTLALLKAIGPNSMADFAQVRASEEPRGPENAPNRKTESAGTTTTS